LTNEEEAEEEEGGGGGGRVLERLRNGKVLRRNIKLLGGASVEK